MMLLKRPNVIIFVKKNLTILRIENTDTTDLVKKANRDAKFVKFEIKHLVIITINVLLLKKLIN